jgi:hypothetical protein
MIQCQRGREIAVIGFWGQSIVTAHLTSTLFMLGLIWFVQIVHYPLYSRVGREVFTEYERNHTAMTGIVVIPPMLIEAGTLGLLWIARPGGVSSVMLSIGTIPLVVIWVSTFFLQVPCHEILSHGFDESAYQRLVSSNWIRTCGWSFRAVWVLLLVSRSA